MLVKAEAPYPVLHVNEHWTALRGQTQADVEGQPLDLLEVRFGCFSLWWCSVWAFPSYGTQITHLDPMNRPTDGRRQGATLAPGASFMVNEVMRGRPASCIMLMFHACRQAFTGYLQVNIALLVARIFFGCARVWVGGVPDRGLRD